MEPHECQKEGPKMEMKVKDNRFYLLDSTDEKWIYDSEEGAIESLKELVSKTEEKNPEKFNIFEVNTAGEQWEIKSVPWSRIAIGLIRGK